MRRPRNRMSQNTMTEELYAVIAIGGAALLLAVVWCAAHLGAWHRSPDRSSGQPGRSRRRPGRGGRPRGQWLAPTS